MNKTHLGLVALALAVSASYENSSFALYIAGHDRDCNSSDRRLAECQFIATLTSTTFTPIAGIIADGSVDLSQADVKAIVLSQAQQIVNDQRNTVNTSENIIQILAATFSARDEKHMARTLLLLDSTQKELSDQNIKEALSVTE